MKDETPDQHTLPCLATLQWGRVRPAANPSNSQSEKVDSNPVCALSKALYHTCFISGQRCKLWSRRPKLTSSVISDVRSTIYIFLTTKVPPSYIAANIYHQIYTWNAHIAPQLTRGVGGSFPTALNHRSPKPPGFQTAGLRRASYSNEDCKPFPGKTSIRTNTSISVPRIHSKCRITVQVRAVGVHWYTETSQLKPSQTAEHGLLSQVIFFLNFFFHVLTHKYWIDFGGLNSEVVLLWGSTV